MAMTCVHKKRPFLPKNSLHLHTSLYVVLLNKSCVHCDYCKNKISLLCFWQLQSINNQYVYVAKQQNNFVIGKLVSTLVLLLASVMVFGQENIVSSDAIEFRFRSIEADFGFYIASYKKRISSSTDSSSLVVTGPRSHSGPGFSIKTSFLINKNILSVGIHTGVELVMKWFKLF